LLSGLFSFTCQNQCLQKFHNKGVTAKNVFRKDLAEYWVLSGCFPLLSPS
jgi:hypothetical protein